jgi:hypothetical protein
MPDTPNPYKKHYTPRVPRKNPQRYRAVPSTGTRDNVKSYGQQVTLRGLMLGPDRRSKKNKYHTDLAIFHKGKAGTRRRHRKHRMTRRR